MRSGLTWIAIVVAGGCKTTPPPPLAQADPPAPVEATADAEPDLDAQCSPSTFERTPDGFSWTVGDAVLRFATSEKADDEPSYNYRNRTARIELQGDSSVYLQSSAYAETDCGAPPDAQGNDRWCLVSYGLEGETTLFGLVGEHRPCEAGLELLDAFARHSTAPTAFRVALPTYPGALWDDSTPYDAMVEAGIPEKVRTEAETYAKAAADADKGFDDPDDNAKAARALEAFRRVLAPHVGVEPAWQLDLLAQRALARVRHRYPSTLVGPNETLYDVRDGDPEPTIVPVTADWASPGR